MELKAQDADIVRLASSVREAMMNIWQERMLNNVRGKKTYRGQCRP